VETATWYLGPAGNLRPLICPERDITINLVRYGGVHQGLSGARTMDVTGHKYEFTFNWKHMEKSEWVWLEALHTRYFPGPFWLISPLKAQLLTRESSAFKSAINGTHGLEGSSVTIGVNTDWPTNVGIATSSLVVTGTGTGGTITLDEGLGFPAVAGETYWVNLYVKNTVVAGLTTENTFAINWLNSSGAVIGTPTQVTLGQSGSWTQVSLSSTPPAGAVTGFVKFLIKNGATYRFAAPMVNIGSAALPWEIGGGASLVVVDQLSTSSPRFPLSDCTMTVLEV
jgi:hypothetical protein